MMKKFALATALLFTAGAASAQSVTVDFEELVPWNGLDEGIYDSPITSGGLVFTNPGDPLSPGSEAFLVLGPDSPIASTNGTITLVPNFFGSTTTVTAEGGGLFTLTSFEFSDVRDFADDPITLTLNLQNGVSQTLVFTADSNPGMQLALVGVSGISSFDFTTSNSLFGENTIQMDNIIYSLDSTGPGVIPEPASWAMMIGGFGLIGGAMRRAKVTKVAYAA